VSLLILYDVPYDVFRVLHVNLEDLDSFTLGFDLLDHLCVDDRLEIRGPVVALLSRHHPIEQDLDNNEHILVRKEQQVLQTCVYRCLRRRIHVGAGVGEEVEELDEAANGKSFELLGSEQRLPQVNVLDDLERNELGHVHGSPAGCWLSELPPILTKKCRVLVRLQALERDLRRTAYLENRLQVLFKERNVHEVDCDPRLDLQRHQLLCRLLAGTLGSPHGHEGQLLVSHRVVLRDAVLHEELAVFAALRLKLDLSVSLEVCCQLRLARRPVERGCRLLLSLFVLLFLALERVLL